MFSELKSQYGSVKLLVTLATIAVSIFLLQILWQVISNFSDIIIMILLAWLLSFILEPLVLFINKVTKLPKIFGAIIVYSFFAIIIGIFVFIFVPVVIGQFKSLSEIIPSSLTAFPDILKSWNNTAIKSVDIFISLIPSLATILIDAILMLILSFYLVVDKERITREIYNFAPSSWHKNLKFIQTVIDSTFASFFRIQVIFAIIAAISTWLVLTIFGVSFAASISLLTGILTLIPVLGQFLGAIPPAFIVLITNPSAPYESVLIFVVLVLIQQIVFNLIGPKLMGNVFKLHPLVVFLSIIIGYKIAGAIGAVFVVPVLSILVIVIKRLAPYFINSEQLPDKN